MSENSIPDAQVETTSVFRSELLKDVEGAFSSAGKSAENTDNLSQGQALLVVKRGPNAGARFLLDQESTTAGRHPEADIFLDDVTVSRHHAEFRRDAGSFEVVDVGSLNGTYVNRQPRDSQVLSSGDEIQIGKFRLVFLTASQ